MYRPAAVCLGARAGENERKGHPAVFLGLQGFHDTLIIIILIIITITSAFIALFLFLSFFLSFFLRTAVLYRGASVEVDDDEALSCSPATDTRRQQQQQFLQLVGHRCVGQRPTAAIPCVCVCVCVCVCARMGSMMNVTSTIRTLGLRPMP